MSKASKSRTRSSFYGATIKHAEGCMALEVPGSKASTSNAFPGGGKEVKTMGRPAVAANRVDNGAQLRTYRLALACTGEYAQFHGGTVGSVLAAMNTSMARVNGIFERDVCLTMEIVANNDQIIASCMPFTRIITLVLSLMLSCHPKTMMVTF